MSAREFRLPDVGEGLTEAEIVRWLVAPGDTVAINDPIVEIETSKSVVELPSPFSGEVATLLVGPGELVAVGAPIVRFQDPDVAAGPGGDPPNRSVAQGSEPDECGVGA